MLAALFAITLVAPAFAEEVILPKGTDVKLAFDNSLSSKTAKVGDKVGFHVEEDVTVDGKTVIKQGAKAVGTVEKVSKKAAFGVNAKIQMKISKGTRWFCSVEEAEAAGCRETRR